MRSKKREEKCLKLYGVKNASQRPDIKAKLTGIDWDSHKQDIIDLCSEGYASHYISEKLSVPHTSLRRRMKEWEISNDGTFQSRRKKTMIERYGEDYGQQGLNKIKEFCQKEYGVDNAFQAEEIKDKIKKTNIERYGFEHRMKDPEVSRMVAKKSLDTRIANGDVFIRDGKTIPELAKEAGFSRSHFNGLIKKYGYEVL